MLKATEIAPVAVGARVGADGVAYRVWAPDSTQVQVLVERNGGSHTHELMAEQNGYWSATDASGTPGDLYRFSLDGGPAIADVASRFQPRGVDGPSECVDPDGFAWKCTGWRRPGWHGQTTYELHIGAFSAEGTFAAAASRLGHLRDLGVEAIEIMPVADFAGARNWGYDGVALFAPARCYGRPDDLRGLVDSAHLLGIAVMLDVVYNHVGPQGAQFGSYCRDYFREGNSPWGQSFNLDGERSGPVREFLRQNAAHWLDEFRVDGLRLDATHAIVDNSQRHLIEEIVELAHSRGAFVVAEDERNTAGILRLRDGGGFGVDAVWADDFHHQVRVALTGIQRSYFAGYSGTAAAIADTIENGWSYRGQPYAPWNGRPRGDSCRHLPTDSFVYCIENHDQVGNRALGERLEHLVDPATFRSASMLLCLNPYPVLMFMGQEWAASSPFLFFSDHGGELGRSISKGRMSEHGHDGGPSVPDPEDQSTFTRSKLSWDERAEGNHAGVLNLYRECLRLRGELRARGAFTRMNWTAVSNGSLIAIRYSASGVENMLLVNLEDCRISSGELPRALRASEGRAWWLVLHSGEHSQARGDAAGGETWALDGPGALWLQARKREGSHGTR